MRLPQREGNQGEFIMKKLIKLAGIIAFAAVIGFSFAACKDDEAADDLDGTSWSGLVNYTSGGATAQVPVTLTFDSPKVTASAMGMPFTGTYTMYGSTVVVLIYIPLLDDAQGQWVGTLAGSTLTFGNMVFTKQ
jgi:hypothetical protein